MAGQLVPRFDAQQLSGLHWAMEGFRLSDPEWCLPTEIQAAYAELHLPFCIIPACLKDLSDLSLEQLTSQVDFHVDDICTSNSNHIVKERRQTAWQGDDDDDEHQGKVAPFAYAGKQMPRKAWSPVVRTVRDLLQEKTGQYYNGCLLNLYPDGGSGMRYHVDPDQGTLWDHATAVVSVGATRRFSFRDIASRETFNFVLMHGDVVEMFGDCQERFQHTVKKADNKKEKAARASLVFKQTWNDKA
jgi:alkylated DNA repair dioxygenase AlkB